MWGEVCRSVLTPDHGRAETRTLTGSVAGWGGLTFLDHRGLGNLAGVGRRRTSRPGSRAGTRHCRRANAMHFAPDSRSTRFYMPRTAKLLP